ncbi:hypothetical protein CTI12_AA512870 [Artemisia annua]|uniref:Zinc finger GRF-type domain-containing protein n=1 Tax=Artemisia annua TaxID=35608 RepID=A0A2U1LAH3_ARTAN|nr:hypothetical protein CTI12_AA512870 [Artemisia annua]
MADYAPGTKRVTHKYVTTHCRCGLGMTVKTAWTKENPRKRFISCPKFDKGKKCGFYEFFDDDLPSDYYRELLYDEHQKAKRGNQRNEMQEDIDVLTMEKAQLDHELTCTKSKLKLYDRLFIILIGIIIIFSIVFGMKIGN